MTTIAANEIPAGWEAARVKARAAGLRVHSDNKGRDYVARQGVPDVAISPIFDGSASREAAWAWAGELAGRG